MKFGDNSILVYHLSIHSESHFIHFEYEKYQLMLKGTVHPKSQIKSLSSPHILMGSQMNLRSPQTVSGVSQQNSVASLQLLKLLRKMLQHCFAVKLQKVLWTTQLHLTSHLHVGRR